MDFLLTVDLKRLPGGPVCALIGVNAGGFGQSRADGIIAECDPRMTHAQPENKGALCVQSCRAVPAAIMPGGPGA
jgi:hypothetical protein